MSKLFKTMPVAERKSERIEIRMTVQEAEAIRELAFIRCISPSDFMRRAALGRRADVRFETETILSLRNVVQAIRSLHASFIARGFPPPQHELGKVLDEALVAMLRLRI